MEGGREEDGAGRGEGWNPNANGVGEKGTG